MERLNREQIAEMVAEMPPFPQSVQELMILTNDINCAPRDLVRVVEHDPVLTGRMIRLVNSAYFGLSRRIESVREAVAFIGLNTLKHLALSVAAVGSLPRTNQAGLRMDQFLAESLAVGAVGRWVGSKLGLNMRDNDNLFLAGLLHQIGQVVLALHVPTSSRQIRLRSRKERIPIYELELELLGTTHYEVGALVAQRWQLADRIVEAVRHHWVGPHGMARTVWMDGLFGAVWLVHSMPNGQTPEEYLPLPGRIDQFGKRLGFPPTDLLKETTEIERVIAKTAMFLDL